MSNDKMREALVAAFMAGSQSGHERTVEGYWRDYDDEIAQEYATEALAAAPKPEQQEAPAERECRHCGFLCRPNPAESRKWYPLEQANHPGIPESSPEQQEAIPQELFDGYAVYKRVIADRGEHNSFTSPENVSAVLDAAVALIRERIADRARRK